MASLNVVSLFTKVTLNETFKLLEAIFDRRTIDLFNIPLTTTYFLHKRVVYEQSDGVTMGSPLSPAIANFFMEDF